MPAPSVNINLGNGNLSRVAPAEDGISLLVATVSGGAGFKGVYLSRKQAEDDGLDHAYDVSNDALVWEHIADFFREAPEGTALHVILLDETKTMADIFTDTDPAYTTIRNYLASQEGKIKLMGVALNPVTEATTGSGPDADLTAAIPLAQAFYDTEFAEHRPIQIVLEARQFSGTPAAADDLRQNDANRVSVMAARDKDRWAQLATDGITKAANAAQLGRALGRVAGLPVQRNIGRVQDGPLVGILEAELSGGQDLGEMISADLDALNDGAYLFYRKFQQKNGFFFADDPTCVDITDDYAFIARGRVMDKASRITYRVLLDELNDEIDVDPDTGQLAVIEVKSLEDAIREALDGEMVALGNLSGIEEIFIDPSQDVLSTDKIEILEDLVPLGYKKNLTATIQYSNPNK